MRDAQAGRGVAGCGGMHGGATRGIGTGVGAGSARMGVGRERACAWVVWPLGITAVDKLHVTQRGRDGEGR